MSLADVRYVDRESCELRSNQCGPCKESSQLIVRIPDHESRTGEYDVYLCRRSRLGFTNPYPSEETSKYLYDAKESSDFDPIKQTFLDGIKDLLAKRQLRRLARPGRTKMNAILDYSTGNGRYAVLSTEVFPQARVDAVDFQDEPPPLIERNLHRVHYYGVDAFTDHAQVYDLIILRHVLEHTHHPVRLLSALRERLAPTGSMYIEVPNLESGCGRMFNKYWKGYYVPRHIFHFTISSLAQVIDLAGLEGDIHKSEMPYMGNTVAILTGTDVTSSVNRFFGILLHPLQLFIESASRSSTCINALVHSKRSA